MTHPIKEHTSIDLDRIGKERLLTILAGDAKLDESNMPNVNLGAVCSGMYLTKRGYMAIGRNRLFKKETNGKYYSFLVLSQVESNTVTASPLHPFYELEGMD